MADYSSNTVAEEDIAAVEVVEQEEAENERSQMAKH